MPPGAIDLAINPPCNINQLVRLAEADQLGPTSVEPCSTPRSSDSRRLSADVGAVAVLQRGRGRVVEQAALVAELDLLGGRPRHDGQHVAVELVEQVGEQQQHQHVQAVAGGAEQAAETGRRRRREAGSPFSPSCSSSVAEGRGRDVTRTVMERGDSGARLGLTEGGFGEGKGRHLLG